MGLYAMGHVDAQVAAAIGTIGPTEQDLPALLVRLQTYPPDKNQKNGISLHASYTQQQVAITIGKLGANAKSAIPALNAALSDNRLKLAAAVALLKIDSNHIRARQIVLSLILFDCPT